MLQDINECRWRHFLEVATGRDPGFRGRTAKGGLVTTGRRRRALSNIHVAFAVAAHLSRRDLLHAIPRDGRKRKR